MGDAFPVIITSYEIVMADRKFLQRHQFKYIVVDEGHRLKNFDCKLLRELKQLHTANKLLLSGTPLQNSLPELWSLLHFLLPDVFSSLDQFQSWFDFTGIVKTEGSGDESARRIADAEHRNKARARARVARGAGLGWAGGRRGVACGRPPRPLTARPPAAPPHPTSLRW